MLLIRVFFIFPSTAAAFPARFAAAILQCLTAKTAEVNFFDVWSCDLYIRFLFQMTVIITAHLSEVTFIGFFYYHEVIS